MFLRKNDRVLRFFSLQRIPQKRVLCRGGCFLRFVAVCPNRLPRWLSMLSPLAIAIPICAYSLFPRGGTAVASALKSLLLFPSTQACNPAPSGGFALPPCQREKKNSVETSCVSSCSQSCSDTNCKIHPDRSEKTSKKNTKHGHICGPQASHHSTMIAVGIAYYSGYPHRARARASHAWDSTGPSPGYAMPSGGGR